MLRFGVLLIAFFIFLVFGRPHDHYRVVRHLHLIRIVLVLAIGAALFSGRWREFLRLKAGWLYAGLTIWLVLGVPFSAWPGGTVELLMDRWLNVIVLFVLITAFAVRVKDVITIALALLAGISLTTYFGAFSASSQIYMGRQILKRRRSKGRRRLSA